MSKKLILYFVLFSKLFANVVSTPQKEKSYHFYKQCPLNSNLPYLQFEFLYWKAQNKGFIAGTFIQNPSTPILTTRPIRVDFEWDPGYRVTLGWNLPYDSWSISTEYTYFHTNVESITNASGSTEGIATYWTLTDELAESVHMKWRLNENLADLILGKSVFIEQSLFLYPFIGFRYGWLYQKLGSDYRSSVSDSGYPSFFSASTNFRGAGPIIGLHADWSPCKNLSFLGKVCTSMLYGPFKTTQTLSEAITFFEPARILSYHDNSNELVPNLQLQVGASWGICFCRDMDLELSLAWETNYWWNQLQLSLVQPNSGIFDDIFTKPITQQGLTAKAAISF